MYSTFSLKSSLKMRDVGQTGAQDPKLYGLCTEVYEPPCINSAHFPTWSAWVGIWNVVVESPSSFQMIKSQLKRYIPTLNILFKLNVLVNTYSTLIFCYKTKACFLSIVFSLESSWTLEFDHIQRDLSPKTYKNCKDF